MSFTLPLGSKAPDFNLRGVDNQHYTLGNFKDAKALVVAFTCNHCPYVIGSEDRIIKFHADYAPRGVGFVAINSNDTKAFPDDGPAGMKSESASAGYTFPYLFDESQHVAKAFRAACTPDLFLFDRHHRLVYRGQFDESRPSKDVPVTGATT